MTRRMFQPAFTSGEVSPSIAARVDLQKYDSAARRLLNVNAHLSGGVSKTPGTYFLGSTRNNLPARLEAFIFNAAQRYLLEFTASALRVLDENGGVKAVLAMPYTETELEAISLAQSADVVFMAHPDYPPRKLMRYADTDWRAEVMTFNPKITPPAAVSASFTVCTGTPKTWRYVVTAVHGLSGEESLASAAVEAQGAESMRVGIMMSDGSALPDWYATISWSLAPNANEYRIYKEKGSGLYGYIGSAVGTSFDDKNIAPDMSRTPPQASYVFNDGDYPACVTLHQQRLVFARTKKQPGTLWFSRVGNYENFTKALFTQPDDFIEVTLASRRMDEITGLAPLRELVVLTTGAEWEISGVNGGAITPGGVSARTQSETGSVMNAKPLVINNDIIHIMRSGNKISALGYNFSKDSYSGVDRTIMATHLFQNRKIKETAYQQSPDSIIWCVMDDGALLGLTYMPEQEIIAWHRHDTDGAYENVCVIPGEEADLAYFVVRREVNGQTARYIEQLMPALSVPEDYAALDDAAQAAVLAEAFYVHSGLSYRGEPITQISGLEHLEGKEIVIFTDGAAHNKKTVKDGAITLNYAARVVHAGLPYAASVETVNYEPEQPDGVGVGKKKRIAQILVHRQNTSGFYVGVNGKDVEIKWRDDEVYGKPARLKSGTGLFSVPGTWSRDSYVSFKSPDPVPMTILGVIPLVSTYE